MPANYAPPDPLLRAPVVHHRSQVGFGHDTNTPQARQCSSSTSTSAYGNFYQCRHPTPQAGSSMPQMMPSNGPRAQLQHQQSSWQFREAQFGSGGPMQNGHMLPPMMPMQQQFPTQQQVQWSISPPKEAQFRSPKRMLTDAGLNSSLSDVDDVVFGRDMDFSDNAVKDIFQSPYFAGACGSTSKMIAQRDEKPIKPPSGPDLLRTDPWNGGVFGNKVEDEIHLGGKQHVDPPGARAGKFWGGGAYDPRVSISQLSPPLKNTRSAKRLLTDAGLNSNLSDVDEVVFGRDQDNSQDAVKDVRQGVAFQGAYGSTSKQINGYPGEAQMRPAHPSAGTKYGHHMLSWPTPAEIVGRQSIHGVLVAARRSGRAHGDAAPGRLG